uniref:Peptidase A1 domain-containing protein n=1 Tax=Ditylenchus dipsaci TaxID=166011 RepID=A0A915D0Q1_9BILA
MANISVGTPAQTFIVEVDYFWFGSLILIDSKANQSSVRPDIPTKNSYNSSQSSSFTAANLNFTSWLGNGYVANDILALGENLKSKVDFGLLNTAGYLFLIILWMDYFWLHRALIHLVLDEPVITIWTNNNLSGNGSSVGTLGALDSEHCESNWAFIPQLGRPWLVNATNAVYDSNSGYYKVDCDTSKAAKIVFNIGGEGNTTSSANKQLVISAANYVLYSESYDFCYLAAYFSKYTSVLEMNIQFLNNHCLAYNIKDKTIGLADSKTPITDVKKYKNESLIIIVDFLQGIFIYL